MATPASTNGTLDDDLSAKFDAFRSALDELQRLRAENARMTDEVSQLTADRKALWNWINHLLPLDESEWTEDKFRQLQRDSVPFEKVLEELRQTKG